MKFADVALLLWSCCGAALALLVAVAVVGLRSRVGMNNAQVCSVTCLTA
jgi:hypothetical protein